MNLLTIMQNDEKQILSTTKGNQLISGLKTKNDSDSHLIKLYDVNAKNATNLRCKLNDKVYAFGTTPKCLFSVSLVGVEDALRNRSYIFEIKNKKINFLTDFYRHPYGFCFIPDFHMYCFLNSYRYRQGLEDPYLDFSFDGLQWIGFSGGSIQCVYVAENALLMPYKTYVDYVFDKIDFYIVKDEKIELYKTFENIAFLKSLDGLELFGVNSKLEFFFHNTIKYNEYYKMYYSNGEWKKKSVSKEEAIAVKECNINIYLDFYQSGNITDCFTGETVEIKKNDNTGEIVAIGNDWTDTYILDYVKNYKADSIKIYKVSATFDKKITNGESIIFDKIQGGNYNIESFYSVLSEFITENSYRVVSNDFSITDGNFTIDIKAGQKIWLCVEGSSPNFAKTIRFVSSDDTDYTGSIQQYVSGYQNYNFYGDDNTGFANVYQYKGRDNNYYSVVSYDVTITDIFFK